MCVTNVTLASCFFLRFRQQVLKLYGLYRESQLTHQTHNKIPKFPTVCLLRGLLGAVTRIQDRVKIFLAVLFWMSLFFWVTVTDGRGKGGKGKKGSRFK
ncbi:hypothetical protein N665_0490s0013 [Sinapis alba]|nr:hypothetical protein N665_0490s0013 [Sinapis alba]